MKNMALDLAAEKVKPQSLAHYCKLFRVSWMWSQHFCKSESEYHMATSSAYREYGVVESLSMSFIIMLKRIGLMSEP